LRGGPRRARRFSVGRVPEELRHRGVSEEGNAALGQVSPAVVGDTRILVVAPSGSTQQTRRLTFQGVKAAHHVLQGKLIGRKSELEAALRSSGRDQHSGSSKLVKDLGQIVPGNGKGLCDIIDAYGCVVSLACKVEDRSEGVFACPGKDHVPRGSFSSCDFVFIMMK